MKRNALFFWTLLCIAAGGSAAIQFDFAGTLQQKLRLYYDRHIPVKIHLTFNQPKYDAGDTAYYKINLFTAEHYRLIGGRQIATVKLLNDQREVVRQSKVLLKDGVGFNQIP